MVSSTLRHCEFQRILIIKPSALGDIMHALPVLHGLRTRYPRARISWLLNNDYVPLLEGHPQLDDIIPFDRHILRRWTGLLRLPQAAHRLQRALQGRNFDLAIDLQGLFRTGLMTLASRARVRLGFRPAREGAGVFYNHGIPVDGDIHAVQRNYAVARVLGFESVPVRFQVPVASKARAALDGLLEASGLDLRSPPVVVLPGSRWETKNWPVASFAAAVERLRGATPLPVILAGSPAERALCADIAAGCGGQGVLNLAGRTDLAGLTALLARAGVVLCNDSGPMHIAAALHKPIVAIFGPTNPTLTGPYGVNSTVLRADLSCSPCFFRKLQQCPHDHACMDRVGVEEVAQAVLDRA